MSHVQAWNGSLVLRGQVTMENMAHLLQVYNIGGLRLAAILVDIAKHVNNSTGI